MTSRTYYRGSKPGHTERITTGHSTWDSYLFVADNVNSARMYGNVIEVVTFKPEARILYEGTAEFRRVAGSWRKGQSLLEFCAVAAQRAADAGYDAVHFTRQTDVGTAIINRNAVTRGEYL
jgi:hypothetical protein